MREPQNGRKWTLTTNWYHDADLCCSVSWRTRLSKSSTVERPNDPAAVYVAVQIVDHASMLNVNVASSWVIDVNGNPVRVFNELAPDFQRRGRRLSELLLEPLVNRFEWPFFLGGTNATVRLVSHRQGINRQYDPYTHDREILRRALVGDVSGNYGWRLYNQAAEASLRNRGLLAPYGLRTYDKNTASTNPTD